mmetsp:Transcript_13331/g.37696  ORF Transcript_13331/g.37696 Transcript_13331/m.37696 type:complete len:199 (+) Transcript_13331:1829-2425(+)
MHDIDAESKRFDPTGNYVRKWLPSLARLPLKYIHRPSNVRACSAVHGAMIVSMPVEACCCLHLGLLTLGCDNSQAPSSVLSDAGVELGVNYPYPIVSPEESARRVQYASEVIASCSPDPPKYKKEPYYPPSDPRLAPEAVRHPWSSGQPGGSVYPYGQFSEMCAGSEDVGSNIIGLSVACNAVESSAVSSFRGDYMEQ